MEASSDHVLLSVHSLYFSKLPAEADPQDVRVISSTQSDTFSWEAELGYHSLVVMGEGVQFSSACGFLDWLGMEGLAHFWGISGGQQ